MDFLSWMINAHAGFGLTGVLSTCSTKPVGFGYPVQSLADRRQLQFNLNSVIFASRVPA
jgi:hypothetical protein